MRKLVCPAFVRGVLLGLGALAWADAVAAAPAPLEKPRTRRPSPGQMEGEWLMRWGGVVAPVTLTRDGRYRCTFCDGCWVGTWAWTAEGDLQVTEAREESAPGALQTPVTWTVRLVRDRRGRLDRTRLSGTADYGGGLPFCLSRKR